METEHIGNTENGEHAEQATFPAAVAFLSLAGGRTGAAGREGDVADGKAGGRDGGGKAGGRERW